MRLVRITVVKEREDVGSEGHEKWLDLGHILSLEHAGFDNYFIIVCEGNVGLEI